MIKEEAEKILKYKDLITEIQRMWNVKAKVIWVTIGAKEPFQITRTFPQRHTGKA